MNPRHLQIKDLAVVGGKPSPSDPGEPLPVWLDNADLHDPRAWGRRACMCAQIYSQATFEGKAGRENQPLGKENGKVWDEQ